MPFPSPARKSIWQLLGSAVLLGSLAAPTAQAGPTQIRFSGVAGAPYLGFVPAVAQGTSVQYQVQFEDRFSDGDFSDWRDPIGPVTGWAEIGADRYVLDGDNWRFLASSFTGERTVSFAFTGSGPLTSDGDAFEGFFVSYSNFTGWHADELLGYRRNFPGGGAGFGYLLLSGTTTVTSVPAPGTLLLVAVAGAALSWRSCRRPNRLPTPAV